ncbi:hypothetical protein AN958_12408 [Leucoagaricus sp. SymC.cos]|nr:hypothetical protein AN958_12408 [Leucoagaricus sp. SymC.cos]
MPSLWFFADYMRIYALSLPFGSMRVMHRAARVNLSLYFLHKEKLPLPPTACSKGW